MLQTVATLDNVELPHPARKLFFSPSFGPQRPRANFCRLAYATPADCRAPRRGERPNPFVVTLATTDANPGDLQQLMVCVKQFEDFYKKSNKGRSLTWQHNLSSCVLRAEFPKVCIKKTLRIRISASLIVRASVCFSDLGPERAQLVSMSNRDPAPFQLCTIPLLRGSKIAHAIGGCGAKAQPAIVGLRQSSGVDQKPKGQRG